MSTNSKRFQKHFDQILCYDILFKDNFENVMQLPKLDKIVLKVSYSNRTAVLDRKRTVEALFMMELIAGQKAKITRAKKSIDKFKLREKMPIGCKVTLRKQQAYCLLDRLINTALPNIEGFVPIRRKTRLHQLVKAPVTSMEQGTEILKSEQDQAAPVDENKGSSEHMSASGRTATSVLPQLTWGNVPIIPYWHNSLI